MHFSDNIIIFRFYLVVAIIFLMPICLIITNECFVVFFYYTALIKCVNKKNINDIDTNYILTLFRYYVKRKKWLYCILMLESYKNLDRLGCYNLLGICYQKIDSYAIAKYYYLMAFSKDSENILVLQNLAGIYKLIGEESNLKKICHLILDLDSENIIASKYLNYYEL